MLNNKLMINIVDDDLTCVKCFSSNPDYISKDPYSKIIVKEPLITDTKTEPPFSSGPISRPEKLNLSFSDLAHHCVTHTQFIPTTNWHSSHRPSIYLEGQPGHV